MVENKYGILVVGEVLLHADEIPSVFNLRHRPSLEPPLPCPADV